MRTVRMTKMIGQTGTLGTCEDCGGDWERVGTAQDRPIGPRVARCQAIRCRSCGHLDVVEIVDDAGEDRT